MSSGAPPAWLFLNNNKISQTTVTNSDGKMAKKDKKNKTKEARSLPLEISSASAPPAQLMDMVEDFLSQHSFTSAHSAFKKQRERKGWYTLDEIIKPASQSLIEVFEAWGSTRSQAASNKDHSEASSDSDVSSDSDSSSDSSDGDDIAMTDAEDDTSSSSSSGSSSSGSESGDEEQDEAIKPAMKATKTMKRKAPAESSSSSESSSCSNSDEDSSSSSDSDNGPKLKKQKTRGASPARSKSSSSSSSTSDSDSDSGSDTSSESEADAEDAAKVPLPDSEESSEPSSSDSSDSESDSEMNADPSKKEIVPIIKDSSDSSVTLEKSPNLKATSLPPLPPDPVLAKGRNDKKNQNEAFSRIPKNIKVDPRFASNAYVSVDYSQRAHEDLIITKGKGFTKEKNKKKRGSYRGGPIDISHNGAVYFDD